MIQIVLFLLACLVLQAAKDACRGGKAPAVRLRRPGEATLRVGEPYGVARCGCKVVRGKMVEACEAHKAMTGV